MAEIITRDSEEFKELAGWIKKAGKAVEEAKVGEDTDRICEKIGHVYKLAM